MIQHRSSRLPQGAYNKSLEEVVSPYVGGEYNQCEGQRNLGRCVTNVKPNQMDFSKRAFGKVLCWDCQNDERAKLHK